MKHLSPTMNLEVGELCGEALIVLYSYVSYKSMNFLPLNIMLPIVNILQWQRFFVE